MKKDNETLIMGRFHIYDALIVIGTAVILLGLAFMGTVFLGEFTLGRASVIIAVILIIAGSISVGNGRSMKKKAVGETEELYADYKAEKKAKKSENQTSQL